MISTALDNFTAPPSSRLLGWHLLDARPKDGWVRIGFDGKNDFCNPAGFVQGGGELHLDPAVTSPFVVRHGVGFVLSIGRWMLPR